MIGMNSITECLLGLCYGIKDSLLGLVLLTSIDDDKKKDDSRPPGRRGNRPTTVTEKKAKLKVIPMLIQCCLLNGGVLLLSVMLFDSYIIPGVKLLLNFTTGFIMGGGSTVESPTFLWAWLEFIMKNMFKYLWVVPLFWLCKILNCIWFVEIADTAYRRKLGRPVSSLITSKESVFKVLSKTMADFVFSIQVETFFLMQAQLVGLLPIVGSTLSFIHMSMLYSLYAFEYTWTNLGWNVVKRISFIENNWPYFVGFGTLLSVLTTVTSSAVISACIFGIIFPIFILSGLDAKPDEKCEYPLRLFSLVIWLTNQMFLFNSKKTASSTDANKDDS